MSFPGFLGACRLVRSRLILPHDVECPVLVILSGLPGTGKSTLAGKLGAALPALVVQSDFVRKTLIPHPTHSAAESEFVHAVARAVMQHFLRSGHSVVADSTNLVEEHRRILMQMAETAGVPALVVRTTAPVEIVQIRLRERFTHRAAYDVSDADWSVYELLSATVEPIGVPHIRVDTTHDLDTAVRQILEAVEWSFRA